MLFLRRTLPLIVAFVFGIIGIAIYYIPHADAQDLEKTLSLWLRIVFAFAFFLGLFSLLNLHWGRIRRRQAGWGYSLIVYISFALMCFFVLYNDGQGPFSAQAKTGGYQWLFLHVQVPAGATMFSILAFFIASAAYRTFRGAHPRGGHPAGRGRGGDAGARTHRGLYLRSHPPGIPVADGCSQPGRQAGHSPGREPGGHRHIPADHLRH